jgi:hypothetical protein
MKDFKFLVDASLPTFSLLSYYFCCHGPLSSKVCPVRILPALDVLGGCDVDLYLSGKLIILNLHVMG